MASYIITKEMAINAACCLVRKKFEKKEEELTKKEHALGEFLARKYYPDPVLQVISLYTEYVGYYSSFYVKYENLPSRRIDTLLRLPTHKNEVYVSIEDYKAVCKFRDKWDNIRKEKRNTETYLIDEILKIRTYNRVKEQAPELLPFLPKEKEEKKLPSVSYDNFRAFVKSIVETK